MDDSGIFKGDWSFISWLRWVDAGEVAVILLNIFIV